MLLIWVRPHIGASHLLGGGGCPQGRMKERSVPGTSPSTQSMCRTFPGAPLSNLCTTHCNIMRPTHPMPPRSTVHTSHTYTPPTLPPGQVRPQHKDYPGGVSEHAGLLPLLRGKSEGGQEG